MKNIKRYLLFFLLLQTVSLHIYKQLKHVYEQNKGQNVGAIRIKRNIHVCQALYNIIYNSVFKMHCYS